MRIADLMPKKKFNMHKDDKIYATAFEPKPNNEYRTNRSINGKGGGRREDNGSFGVERKDMICMSFREFGECGRGEHCKYKHITPDKVCENAEFQKSGFCDQYFECECKHPWDAARGDKREAWKKCNDEKYNERKGMREKNANEYQRGFYMVEPCDYETGYEGGRSRDDAISASEKSGPEKASYNGSDREAKEEAGSNASYRG